MITRKSLRPHICLRCQRNLAKRSLHHQSPALSQTLLRRASYSRQAAPKSHNDEKDDGNNSDVNRISEDDYGSPKSEGNLRGLRGMFRREDLEELRGATALGDKAKVIVLRDSIFRKYILNPTLDEIKPTHIDILGTLAEERGLIGEDEVEMNINAFRPQDGIRDFAELNDLIQKLERGFTISQLENYMKNFKDKRELEKPIAPWRANDSHASILKITPWLPGVSPIDLYFDNDPLREYYLRSHTPKQVLALRLLRECWMLELPELADGIGQFEVKLRNDDLDLLLLGPNSVLNTINATHLSFEDERLEVFRSRNAIRVTTTNAKKYAIVHAIQAAVNGIQRGDMNLLAAILPREMNKRQVDRFMNLQFDDAALAALGEVTGTKITKGAAGHLQVAYIDHNPGASGSRIDDVRRLILTFQNLSTRLEYQLAIKQTESTSGGLVEYVLPSGLNWRQKMRSWMRFTAPISKEPPEIAKPIIEPELASLPSTQASAIEPPHTKDPTEEEELNEDRPHWSTRYFTNTSALVGTVLHSDPQGCLGPNSSPVNSPGLVHAFSTRVPNLSRVLSRASTPKKSRTIERLIIRLLPDPLYQVPKNIKRPKYPSSFKKVPIGVEALSAFPSLEMAFEIDRRTRESTLQKVEAVLHEKRTDVMIPENAVDIRFQQRTTSRLSKRFLKPIRTFIADSQLDLAGKGRLYTPPSLKLPISAHICQKDAFKMLWPLEADQDSNEREVRYLFAGLEIHRTLVFDWEGFRVNYTSIEAGKAGGSRAELRIRPIKHGEVVPEKNFVNAAYRLADMLGDGSGEHIGMDTVKSVETSERHNGVMKSIQTKPQLLFQYFGGKLKLNRGVDQDTLWEESEDIDAENESGASDVDEEDDEMNDIDDEELIELEDARRVEEELEDEMLQRHPEWTDDENSRRS